MLQYWAVRAGAIVRYMPLRLAYFLGDVAATLTWWLWRGPRATAIENLTRVLGDRAAARRAARYSFLNFARYAVDFLRAPKIALDDVIAKVQYEHWDQIDAAFQEGNGVIFTSVHQGNWEMGGAVLAARGYPMNVIANPFGDDRANAMVVASRQVRGMKVIPANRAAAGIVRAIRRNEALAILMDTPVEGNGVEIQFFGRRTTVPAGPARIALRTGARVIPTALVRASGTSDQIIALVDLDVRVAPTGDLDRDVQALTQRIFAAHERFVRAYPDQWYIFRRMWPEPRPAPASEPAFASKH